MSEGTNWCAERIEQATILNPEPKLAKAGRAPAKNFPTPDTHRAAQQTFCSPPNTTIKPEFWSHACQWGRSHSAPTLDNHQSTASAEPPGADRIRGMGASGYKSALISALRCRPLVRQPEEYGQEWDNRSGAWANFEGLVLQQQEHPGEALINS